MMTCFSAIWRGRAQLREHIMEMYEIFATKKVVPECCLQSHMDRMATVEQFALDTHVDMTAAGSAAAESVVAGSAAAVAESAAMSGGEIGGG